MTSAPDGDPAEAPERTLRIGPGRTPYIVTRKDTPHRPLLEPQHIPPEGHPSSATEKIPCMAPPGMHSFIKDGINLNTNLECES